jgi:hypothetical protein
MPEYWLSYQSAYFCCMHSWGSCTSAAHGYCTQTWECEKIERVIKANVKRNLMEHFLTWRFSGLIDSCLPSARPTGHLFSGLQGPITEQVLPFNSFDVFRPTNFTREPACSPFWLLISLLIMHGRYRNSRLNSRKFLSFTDTKIWNLSLNFSNGFQRFSSGNTNSRLQASFRLQASGFRDGIILHNGEQHPDHSAIRCKNYRCCQTWKWLLVESIKLVPRWASAWWRRHFICVSLLHVHVYVKQMKIRGIRFKQ